MASIKELFFWILILLVGFTPLIWSLVWVTEDAERRGKPGYLVAFLVAFFGWPFTLLVWIVLRPEDPSSRS